MQSGVGTEPLITGEDVDFSYRLLRAYATTIVYCAGAVLYHHARADGPALRRQARSYGAGVADLYRMYPGEVCWDFAKTLRLLGVLASRFTAPFAGIGAALGLIDERRAEFLKYQSLWTRNFWFGFGMRALQSKRSPQ